MKAIEVGSDVLNLPTDVFETDFRKGTIIDSGTTLAYFPDVIYDPLITKVTHKSISLYFKFVFLLSYHKTI